VTRMISMQVDVPPDRRLFISVPQDVPVGPAQVIIIRLDQAPPAGTAAEMVSSPLFGLWAGRDDIEALRLGKPLYTFNIKHTRSSLAWKSAHPTTAPHNSTKPPGIVYPLTLAGPSGHSRL